MKNRLLVFLLAVGLASCGQMPGQLPEQSSTSPVLPTATSPQATKVTPTLYATYTPAIIPTDALPPIPTKTRTTPTPLDTLTPLPSLGAGQQIILKALNMLDAKTGWGIESGGQILRTTDGGGNWRDVTPASGQYSAASFFALDARRAWAVSTTPSPCVFSGQQYVCPTAFTWQTIDGGSTWQRGTSFQVESDYRPVALQFIDSTTGWLLYVDRVGMSSSTYMGLAATEDGGASWTFAKSPGNVCLVSSLVFLNDQDGWSGTDCRWVTAIDGQPYQDFLHGKVVPSLLKTDKGGRIWDDFPMPASIVFPPTPTPDASNPDPVVFCGVSKMIRISTESFWVEWSCSVSRYLAAPNPSFSYDYLTSDHAQTWHSWLATGNESFVNPLTGWRMFSPGDGQSNQLQQTTDGGLTWKTVQKVAWPSVQFDFINEQTGWAIVTGSEGAYALIHTEDGGKTWVDVKAKAGPYQAPGITTPPPTPLPSIPVTSIYPGNAGQVVELARRSVTQGCQATWSPDGSLLAAGGEVTLYKTRTMSVLQTLDYYSCHLAFSPDGMLLATSRNNGGLQLWNVADGTLARQQTTKSYTYRLAYSPDGTRIASGMTDNSALVWRSGDLSVLAILKGHTDFIEDMSFSPDGSLLATASRDKTIKLWEVASGRLLRTLAGHTSIVESLAFSPDGLQLASGSFDGTLRLWRVSDGSPIQVLNSTKNGMPTLAYSPDGRLLAVGTYDGLIEMWDTSTWQTVGTLAGHTNWVASVAFSPDGMRLVSASGDGTLRVWGIVSP